LKLENVYEGGGSPHHFLWRKLLRAEFG